MENDKNSNNLNTLLEMKKLSNEIHSKENIENIIEKLNGINLTNENIMYKQYLSHIYSNILKNIYLNDYMIDDFNLDKITEFFIYNYINLSQLLDESLIILPIIYKYNKNKDDIIKIILYNILNERLSENIKNIFIGISEYLYNIDINLTNKIICLIIELFNDNCCIYSDINYLTCYEFSHNHEGRIVEYDALINILKDDNILNNIDFIINIENKEYNKYNLFLLYCLIIIFAREKIKYLEQIKNILKIVINSKIDYSDISHISYSTIEFIERKLAMYISESYKEHYINEIISILKDSCKKQPYLVFKLMIYLEEICETNNNVNIFWDFYYNISNVVKEMINNNSYDSNNFSEKRLIYHMLFTEMPWQRIDLEKQYIKFGKKYILEFAKDTYFLNEEIILGMSKLMIYFNDIFFEDFILLLSNLNINHYKNLNKDIYNYIILSIDKYIYNSYTYINNKIYDSILNVLDCLIKLKISNSYMLKLFLLTNKKKN